MEEEKRGVGSINFRWWRKPECSERTTGQLQVIDNLLTYLLLFLPVGDVNPAPRPLSIC